MSIANLVIHDSYPITIALMLFYIFTNDVVRSAGVYIGQVKLDC